MKTKLSVVICLFTCICFNSNAQKLTFPFGGQYDENQILHLGFFFTTQISYYKATKNLNWQGTNGGVPGQQLIGITTPAALGGIGFGIPVDVRLGGNANFILRPTYLIFSNQAVNYHYLADDSLVMIPKYHKEEIGMPRNTGSMDKNFFAFEMPILFKFKSDMKQIYGEDKYRVYVVGGIKWSRNIGRNKYYDQLTENPPDRMPLIIKSSYFSYDAGVGVDLFFDYFKMSAELKWSQTMNSVLDKKLNRGSNPFMDPIDKLLLRSLQFSLIFE